jgi:hypothetical protein
MHQAYSQTPSPNTRLIAELRASIVLAKASSEAQKMKTMYSSTCQARHAVLLQLLHSNNRPQRHRPTKRQHTGRPAGKPSLSSLDKVTRPKIGIITKTPPTKTTVSSLGKQNCGYSSKAWVAESILLVATCDVSQLT